MATKKQIGYGSQGSEVTELQKLLNSNGYNLETDGIYGDKTMAAVKDYQQKNSLDVDGIVGDMTWGALTGTNTTQPPPSTDTSTDTTPPAGNGFSYGAYEKSDVVKQAEALLQQQLAQKPGAYQSAWQTTLDETLQKILNREKFSYDLNGDALYQQYKDQYMLQGQQAMMDTMGQAAAMTGGYGNSYAQTVGQQTYQGYMQQLNDKVPELYQLALNQYNREGDELYNQYGLYADRENQDYGRYRDALADYNTELGRLTDDARYQAETDYGKFMDGFNMSYGQYRDQKTDEKWQAEFDEAQRQFNIANDVDTGSGGSSGGGSNPGSNPGSRYDAEAARKQQILIDAGYKVAKDGIWGPQSQAAWEKYQKVQASPTNRPPVEGPSTEEEMQAYVKRMLDNATSSQFNPKAVINANSSLSSEEKKIALEILDLYIGSGYMKF